MKKKLLIVQYGGDYRETYANVAAGKPEYYANQTYSIEAVKALKNRVSEVATLCFYSLTTYPATLLEPGVKAIGLGLTKDVNYKKAMRAAVGAVAEYGPTEAILRTPSTPVLRWLRKNGIPCSVVLADSFNSDEFKKRVHYYLLARELNHPNVRWVANHGIGSCLSLTKIGVKADKVIPWDWPTTNSPNRHPVKPLAQTSSWRLLYVGAISEAKGVTDCIEAVAILRRAGVNVELDIFGKGSVEECQALAVERGVGTAVHFCGMIPNTEIIDRMHSADLVLIPSRRSYPEGFPKTINEALCSRTPLVVSDHPIFARLLKNEQNAMVFESGCSGDIAEKIRKLLGNPSLYLRLSQAAEDTWAGLQIPVKWGVLLEKIISDAESDKRWLVEHRLNSGNYSLG